MGHQVWEGHAMMALNLDTFTLFIVLTLTYGLHNSAKCFSHYQHNIFFSGKLICMKYDDPKINETYIFGDGWKSVLY